MKIPQADVYLEESLALYTELADRFGIGQALSIMGDYYLAQYHDTQNLETLQRAEHYYQQSLDIWQQHESLFGIACAHMGLCTIAELYEDYSRALKHIQLSRNIFGV